MSAPEATELRPIEPEEFRELHAIAARPEVARFLGGSPFEGPEGLRLRLEQADPERVHLLGAYQAGRLQGFVRLTAQGRPRRRHVGSLALAVSPERQGHGLGRSLLSAALDVADRWLDLCRVELDVHADHERALRLYRQAGFEVEARRPLDMLRDGRLVDGLVMGRLRPGLPAMPPRRDRPFPEGRRVAPGPIAIRPVEVADAGALARLHRVEDVVSGTFQLPTMTVAGWRKRLAQDGSGRAALLVAGVGGAVAGAAGLFGEQDRRLAHRLTLGIAVDPAFQGMGVGERLITSLLEAADLWLGVRRVELEVYPDNLRAQRLYEKHGFVLEGTRRLAAFRDGRYEDSLIYGRIR